jgi:hypothetical protein
MIIFSPAKKGNPDNIEAKIVSIPICCPLEHMAENGTISFQIEMHHVCCSK